MPWLLVSLCILLSPLVAAAEPSPQLREMVKRVDKGDLLAARILARKVLAKPLDMQSWRAGRKALESQPGVGWDMLVAWSKGRPASNSKTDLNASLDTRMGEADTLMTARRFEEAFRTYQKIAQDQQRLSKNQRAHELSRQAVFHSMARALYGASRFEEALEVYQWVAPSYPFFRQIQFEKAWSALRAGRYDLALGAIASSASSYFYESPDPEILLLQAYVYRKLCRVDDLQSLQRSLESWQAKIKTGAFDWRAWSLSEIETRSYLRLAESKVEGDTSVSSSDRAKERKLLTETLKRRFAPEKVRLTTQLEKVSLFVRQASESKISDLPIMKSAPDLAGDRFEFWPVTDKEDWLDEVGNHVFFGTSQCRKN